MKNYRFLNKFPYKLYIATISLFIVFAVLLLLDVSLGFFIDNKKILPVTFNFSKSAQLPIIKTYFVPEISAKGAIILDSDSNVVLYSKNPDLRFSTASTTKIMTALTALDYFQLSDELIVKKATDEGSVLGLREGEKMTFENLLYAMLLPSANDAALTISQNYPGGEKGFLEKMNAKAKNLMLYNTHYLDPAGLEDASDYTTPFDLARLASYAIKNPVFREIVKTKDKYIYDTNGQTYSVSNLNQLLGNYGVTGIKTGYTQEAGQVLVTSKLEKGKTIIIVVMGSEDRFADTIRLIELVSNNLTYLSIHP